MEIHEVNGAKPTSGSGSIESAKQPKQPKRPIFKYRDGLPKAKLEKQQREEQFNAVQKVYTNKAEYKAALKEATANGTYNPDAPEFIFADKNTVRNLQKLEQASGQKMFKEDGTIDAQVYKDVMKSICGNNFAISPTELKFAQDNGLSKSEIKDLAKQLGIKMQSEKEVETETKEAIQENSIKLQQDMWRLRTGNQLKADAEVPTAPATNQEALEAAIAEEQEALGAVKRQYLTLMLAGETEKAEELLALVREIHKDNPEEAKKAIDFITGEPTAPATNQEALEAATAEEQEALGAVKRQYLTLMLAGETEKAEELLAQVREIHKDNPEEAKKVIDFITGE